MPIKITNEETLPIIDGYELTGQERNEFDYINWDAIEKGNDSASFVRYKGELYDLNDLEVASTDIFGSRWKTCISQTLFSGILFSFSKNPDEDDEVTVAMYYVSD